MHRHHMPLYHPPPHGWGFDVFFRFIKCPTLGPGDEISCQMQVGMGGGGGGGGGVEGQVMPIHRCIRNLALGEHYLAIHDSQESTV